MKRNTRWKPLLGLWLPLFLLFWMASSRATAAVPGIPVQTPPRPVWSPYNPGNLAPAPAPPSVPQHPRGTYGAPASWRPQAATTPRWPYALPSTAMPPISRQPRMLWMPAPVWRPRPVVSSLPPAYRFLGYVPPSHQAQPQLGLPQAYAQVLGVPSHHSSFPHPGEL